MGSLVERAEASVASLRAARDTIEAGRRLPPAITEELAAKGFYRMLVPRAYGGEETHPRTFAEVLETLARGDSAAGWTMMTGSTTGLLAAYLPREGAEEIFADSSGTYAGVFAPMGKAQVVDGGYRVTGRWPFTSGVENARWRLGGALVFDEGSKTPRMRTGADGREVPEIRSFFFPAADTQVLDTWDTGGLRGTGSHDMAVEDVFVPTQRSANVFEGPVVDAPLYALPLFGLLAAGIGAVGLGIAREAIDELRAVASRAPSRPGAKPLGASEWAQLHLARAEAALGAARRYLLGTLDDVAAKGACTDRDRVELRLAAAHAVSASAEVVDRMHTLAGGAAVYARNPIERHFRDVHTLTQHVMVAEKTMRPLGRFLAGLPTDTSQL